MKMHSYAAMAAVVAVSACTPAAAQQPSGTLASVAIDLSPIITEVIKVGVLVAGGIITFYIKKWLGEKAANEVKDFLEPILQNGLAFGQLAAKQLPHSIASKNAIVAQAINYVIASASDKLRGVSTDHIRDMLLARLEANVSAQSSAVTATAAAPMPTTVSAPKAPDGAVVVVQGGGIETDTAVVGPAAGAEPQPGGV